MPIHGLYETTLQVWTLTSLCNIYKLILIVLADMTTDVISTAFLCSCASVAQLDRPVHCAAPPNSCCRCWDGPKQVFIL